jgi:hypothetical protein
MGKSEAWSFWPIPRYTLCIEPTKMGHMDTKHIRSGGTGITQRWNRGQLGVKMGGKPQSCHQFQFIRNLIIPFLQSSDTPMISPFFRDYCCFNLTINHEMGDELPLFSHYVASHLYRDAFSMINSRWCPLVTSWFINPPNSGYNPHKPFVNLVTNQLS